MPTTITAKDVNELRQKTGLGMMECKKALTETDGDVEKAVDLLRQRGLMRMNERTDRASAEGRIAAAVSPDRSKGAIVEINTETDFTAGNETFKSMANRIAQEALRQEPGEAQKTDAIQSLIDDVRLTTKENVQFGRGQIIGGGGTTVGSYVHFNGKIGVLVEVEGHASPELLTDLCQHIAAVTPSPIGVNESDIPPDVLEREKQIAKAQAMEQGKPEQIAEKMVVGKVRKFYEDHVLLQQLFIKDDKKRVKDLLPQGVTVKRFIRYQLGAR